MTTASNNKNNSTKKNSSESTTKKTTTNSTVKKTVNTTNSSKKSTGTQTRTRNVQKSKKYSNASKRKGNANARYKKTTDSVDLPALKTPKKKTSTNQTKVVKAENNKVKKEQTEIKTPKAKEVKKAKVTKVKVEKVIEVKDPIKKVPLTKPKKNKPTPKTTKIDSDTLLTDKKKTTTRVEKKEKELTSIPVLEKPTKPEKNKIEKRIEIKETVEDQIIDKRVEITEEEKLEYQKIKEKIENKKKEVPVEIEEKEEAKVTEKPKKEEPKEEQKEEVKKEIKEEVKKTKKSKTKEYKPRKKSELILNYIFSLINVILGFAFVYTIVKINILPMKYLIILISALTLFIGLVLFMIWRRKVWKKIIGIILTAALGTILVFATLNINETFKYLQQITNSSIQKTKYYVIVPKDSTYNSIKDLNGKRNGLLKNNATNVEKELSELTTLNYSEYDSVGWIVRALRDNTVESLTISSDIYNLLEESYKSFYETIRILHTFEVQSDTSDSKIYELNIDEPFIVYISGIDLPDYPPAYGRSDANIILVVNPKTNHILLVNTPRDFYVPLHGVDGLNDKVTHAGLYGIDMSVSTLEDLYNIRINGYVKVSYKSVINVVNAIDGIDVYSDQAFTTSHQPKKYVTKGMNHFNGEEALAFSQERYAYYHGDRHRGENQQAVLTAIITKVSTNKEYLLKYNDILKEITPTLTTNVSMENVQKFVKNQIDTLKPWKIESVAVNGYDADDCTYTLPDACGYVMKPNQETVDAAKQKINEVLNER